jgi:DNA-binding LacI/PurR family transcriptional regulator/DNA-binding CsgD family transcriptional regulator/PAS domain-containing protein
MLARRRSSVERSRTVIGFLINQSEGRYQALLRRGLTDFCREKGIALRLFGGRSFASPYGHEDDENHIYSLARPGRRPERLDGLVVATASIANYITVDQVAAFLDGYRPLPIVSIGLQIGSYPTVVSDSAVGITEVVTHLVHSHGHRRVAFLSGPPRPPDAHERLEAYFSAVRAAGLPPDSRLVLPGDFTYGSGERLAAALDVSGGLPFDAVVAANDDSALGFLAGMERRGFTCPRDFALTGFDDLPDARFASPALTTVHQPMYQEGWAAGEKLLALLAGKDPAAVEPTEPLTCSVVYRRSCGCSEALRVASRIHRGTERPAGAPPAALRDTVVAAAASEGKISARNRAQAHEVLAALADTILLDLRAFRDQPLYLQTLAEWFDLTSGWEDFSADWHRILTLLHREVLRSIVDLRKREHADDLLQAGFALLARKAGERDARELGALRGVMRVFRDLSGRLSTVADVESLLQALRELLPETGLTRLTLYLHRAGPVPLDREARDAFAGEMVEHPIIDGGTGDEQVFLPIVSRRHAHGYALLESDRMDGLILDLVRDQLADALGSILLARERSRAEEELRRSEERFRELASAVPMMVLETDLALNVSYVNPAARAGLGLAPGEACNLERHLSAEDEPAARELVQRLAHVRVTSYPNVRLLDKDRRRYVPVVQVTGIFDAAGRLAGLRWNALDPLPLLVGGMLPDPAFFTERKITGREQEVVELLLQGFRIRDMADRLFIAESTVKGHLTQVYNKLGISGREELLQLVQEEQIRRRGFSAHVFGLVSRLLHVDEEAEPGEAEEPVHPRVRSS